MPSPAGLHRGCWPGFPCVRCGRTGSRPCLRLLGFLVSSLDVRPDLLELFLDALVAAINMIRPVDDRLPLGHQTRYDEAGGGTQIRGHSLGAGEGRPAMDHRRMAVDVDM